MGTCSFLIKAHLLALLLCGFYIACCFLLALPGAQRQYLFLHNVRLPPFVKYDQPHEHGMMCTYSNETDR